MTMSPQAIELRKKEILRHPELKKMMQDQRSLEIINALMEVLANDTENRSYKNSI